MSDRERDTEQGAGDISDQDRAEADVPEESNADATDPVEEQPEMSDDDGGGGLPVGEVFRSGG